MKINLTTSTRVVINGIDTLADTINVFKSDDITKKNRDQAKKKAMIGHTGQGAGYTYDYKVDGCNVSLEAEIEDGAIIMALPMAVKIAQIVMPLLTVGKAILSLLDGLKGQFHAVGMEFTNKFQERYGRKKTYAVASVWSDELEMANVVVVEDDGFGHLELISSDACWNEYDNGVVMKVFMKTYERGQETADDKKIRYPLITFEEITKEEAIDRAIKMRPSLQADVDGMRNVVKE